VKFEDLQKNFPLLGHQSWRLRKFSKFFEKIFFAQMLPNGPIRKVITLKVKFEDLRLHLSLWRHGSRLRKFFDRKFFDQKKFFFKVSKWFNSQSYQVKKISGVHISSCLLDLISYKIWSFLSPLRKCSVNSCWRKFMMMCIFCHAKILF